MAKRWLNRVVCWNYAEVLYENPAATLADLREAVTTLEEIEPIARRVFGGAHLLVSETYKFSPRPPSAGRRLQFRRLCMKTGLELI